MQPTCKSCGQPIWGEYLSALGNPWHPEHFTCAVCGLPIGGTSFHQHQGAAYHIDCYNRTLAPRCAYCGKPLVNEYLVDHWGTKFCKEHGQQYPHCAYCGRLVPPHEQEANAESIRCATCRSTAIETAAEAKPIFRRLIQWVSGQGLRYNNLPLSLELCSRAKLASYLGERGQNHSLGATMGTTYTQDGHSIRTEVTGVAVLLGLPSTLFEGTTIHELGHVWLIVQDVQNLPIWAEEGFCELLSHRYFTESNTPENTYHATNIERNSDPIYGEGFQRIRAIVDRVSFQRFIETLQTTKRLPSF